MLVLPEALDDATTTFGEVAVHETERPDKVVALALIGPHFRTEAAVCRVRQCDRPGRIGHGEIRTALLGSPFAPTGRKDALHDLMKLFELRTAETTPRKAGEAG